MNRLNIILLVQYIFVIITSAFAQEGMKKFDIKIQEKPAIAGTLLIDYPKMSALVIWSSKTDLHFESNMNGIVANLSDAQDGKYILVLKPETKQIITVKASGFIPGKVRIPKLEQKEFVYYQIESAQKPLNPDRGKFILRTIPAEVSYKFDGLPIEGTTPYNSEEFATGTFKILLTKNKYEPAEITISIIKGEVINKTVNLVPKFGFIRLNCDAGSILYLDNKLTSFTNNVPIEVSVGNHKILLKKTYYDTQIREINVPPGQIVDLKTELVRQTGKLTVLTNPEGAQVSLSGKKIGTTPIVNLPVRAGRPLLEIKKKDYRPEQLEIEILKDENERIELDLAQDGIINIRGTVGATFAINGKHIGSFPYNRSLKLPQGRYRITVSKPNYDTEEKTIELGPETRNLRFDLVPTVGRPFRFIGFGNERVSSLINSWAIGVNFHSVTYSENLMYTLARQESAYKSNNFSLEALWMFSPVTISFGYEFGGDFEPGFDDAEIDTLRLSFMYANMSWSPIIFWEKVYPSVGLSYNYGNFSYEADGDKIGKYKYQSVGFNIDLTYLLKLNDLQGGFFAKAGYRGFLDSKPFGGYLFLQLSAWYKFKNSTK